MPSILQNSQDKRNDSASLPFALPDLDPGWVWLAGAGPGDPGLLTLHAWQGLQQAEVVVYDALVDERILKLASPECKLEYAGKRGGKPSPKQAAITERLIHLARQHKRVLRLKGGDPFVFGRGGEEARQLVEAGVPFRLIPGITAGIGGLAYAGIPVTHRDTNSAVTFLTGHGVSGQVPEQHDWEGIAKGSPVIVMYMVMKHLALIAERLLGAGRSPDEPMAVIVSACTPRQQVLETTLACCADDVQTAGLEPPAVVVMGEVVRLREHLDWLGKLGSQISEQE
ncbi:MAG: uroporphyrinogen-III C-methyltransferase, partial [SAR324 cluster bacterium]|nr:uroporphyrinogen-III C-methyltransferase [SAR324 cluster bacterium]